ncbi:acyltransferase family protein [Parasedimentitalea huanghaiensis]|uniref:acyltransferase family protein n=1 Tax=Parasedimentitalea huanghaiensis TaxID=2682100 RepID=UPI001431F7DB|nr:acyltransferase [Zongyanglinia huanghaiensis]
MKKETVFLRTYGDTDFITGLRAVAATMVVMIHTAALSEFGAIGQAITSAGKYGVDIFFVISGFTIAKTFTEARNYSSYLTRRIMRIVPLYWLAITLAMLLIVVGALPFPYWMQELGSEPNLYNYLMHLSMASFLDYKVANSVLGVEWTIPIEVFWYVFLPPLLYFAKTVYRTIGAFVFFHFLSKFLFGISEDMFGTVLPITWSPAAHGEMFFIGATSFYLRARFKTEPPAGSGLWIGGAVALFALALVAGSGRASEALAFSTAILIVCVTPDRAKWVTRPLTSRPMLFLGSISYSLYLFHLPIMSLLGELNLLPGFGLAKFMLVYGTTVVVSMATYALVEKPTNRLGLRLALGAK